MKYSALRAVGAAVAPGSCKPSAVQRPRREDQSPATFLLATVVLLLLQHEAPVHAQLHCLPGTSKTYNFSTSLRSATLSITVVAKVEVVDVGVHSVTSQLAPVQGGEDTASTASGSLGVVTLIQLLA